VRDSYAVAFKTAAELGSEERHRRWLSDVDTLMDDLGVGWREDWTSSNVTWEWCADGRKALARVGDRLRALGLGRTASARSVAEGDAGSFECAVTWKRGVWGSMIMVNYGEFDRPSFEDFDHMLGRYGWDWRPSFPWDLAPSQPRANGRPR
jgi:hypothetical protein